MTIFLYGITASDSSLNWVSVTLLSQKNMEGPLTPSVSLLDCSMINGAFGK